MRKHILYHLDADGFGAAWAVWKKLGDEADYMPVNYDMPVPEFPAGDEIIIVDFSYKRPILVKMSEKHPSILVLDHHKTAQENLQGLDFAKFETDKAGAVMAWEHFHPDKPVPKVLQYVQDYDLWKFELQGSKEINAAIQSYPQNFETWSGFEIEGLLKEGVTILRSTQQSIETICKQAYLHYLPGGFLVPIVNATTFWSQVGNKLLELYSGNPFSASYYVTKDLQILVQLRSRPGGFDVGAYAKQYGGGGHQASAGFVKPLKWAKDMEII